MYKCWSGNITYAATHHPPGRYDACLPTVPVLHVEASLNVAAQIACRPQERRSADSIRDRIAFVVRARRFRELQRYCLQHRELQSQPPILAHVVRCSSESQGSGADDASSTSADMSGPVDAEQSLSTFAVGQPATSGDMLYSEADACGFCLRHSSLRAWTRPCRLRRRMVWHGSRSCAYSCVSCSCRHQRLGASGYTVAADDELAK